MHGYKYFIWLVALFTFCFAPLDAAKRKASSKTPKPPQPTLESPQKKPFSIIPPKGWECIDDKKQLPAKVELVFIGTGKGQFTPSLNLATEETSLSVVEYVKLAQMHHASQGETTCRSLGTLETQEGPAHMLQIDRNTQWGVVRFIQGTVIKNGVAYVITTTCLQEDFIDLSPHFLRAIQSFTINPL